MLSAVADTEVGVPKPTALVAIKLGHPARIAAYLLGLAGLGAGGAAVFMTHLEVGPVGLLTVGLVFMIIGLSGTLPTRLKVGDNEAAWEIERQAVEMFVERVAEDVVPVVNQREFLGALNDLAEDAPRFAAPLYSALAYERIVMSMLEDAVKTLGEDVNVPSPVLEWQPRRSNVKMDAVISSTDGRTLIVELKASHRAFGRDVLRQLQVYRDRMPGLSGGLLISRYPIRGSDLLIQEPYTYYIVVAGREDQNELTRVIRRAFDELSKTRHSDGSRNLEPPCEHNTSVGSARRRWHRCSGHSDRRHRRRSHRATLGQPA